MGFFDFIFGKKKTLSDLPQSKRNNGERNHLIDKTHTQVVNMWYEGHLSKSKNPKEYEYLIGYFENKYDEETSKKIIKKSLWVSMSKDCLWEIKGDEVFTEKNDKKEFYYFDNEDSGGYGMMNCESILKVSIVNNYVENWEEIKWVGMSKTLLINIMGDPENVIKKVSRGKKREEFFYGKYKNRLGNNSYKLRVVLINDVVESYNDIKK
jgi:hypothetical protein